MVKANNLLQYPPITGVEAGSFARFTIEKRLPEILHRILADASRGQTAKENLIALHNNICHGKIELLPTKGPDVHRWTEYLHPYLGKSWFEAPFYFIEAYFYRLILDAVNYYENRLDPFHSQKMDDISANIPVMLQMIAQLEKNRSLDFHDKLQAMLQLSLWGNKSDLSQLRLYRNGHGSEATLIDDAMEIVNLISGGISRVDIVLDNSGMELFTDLLLADWLISQNIADHVVLHAKSYPTFVSDATVEDVDILINLLGKDELFSMKAFVSDFKNLCERGRITLSNHEFWNTPLHFYEMPDSIEEELSKSDLIIFKGDANYRRIFGDRVIPHDAQPQLFSSYLPARSASVRILKSEIICGIPKEKSSHLTTELGNEWLVSGRFGIIQLLN